MQVDSTDPNCCWGGKTGMDACFRQAKSQACRDPEMKKNFCVNIGIPRSKCVRAPPFSHCHGKNANHRTFRTPTAATPGLDGASLAPRARTRARTPTTAPFKWGTQQGGGVELSILVEFEENTICLNASFFIRFFYSVIQKLHVLCSVDHESKCWIVHDRCKDGAQDNS